MNLRYFAKYLNNTKDFPNYLFGQHCGKYYFNIKVMNSVNYVHCLSKFPLLTFMDN